MQKILILHLFIGRTPGLRRFVNPREKSMLRLLGRSSGEVDEYLWREQQVAVAGGSCILEHCMEGTTARIKGLGID